jgi:hypothetical protein
MTSTELVLGFAVPFAFMVLGYWKSEVWLFYIASVMWLAFMGFLFNNYTTADFFYYTAWMCLALAIVCATAQLWMDKGKPMPTLDNKDSIDDHREKMGKKLAGLRGLRDKLQGR